MQTAEHHAETGQPQTDLYQKLTDTVISHLEAGNTPWQKSMAGDSVYPYPRMPINIVSGKEYTGINTLLLWCTGLQHSYSLNEWAGFRQWKQQEESIRKGERGTPVVYYAAADKDESNETSKASLKSYVVFNRCQLGSYSKSTDIQAPVRPLTERLAVVDEFVSNIGSVITHKGKKSGYDISKDEIHMPKREAFKDNVQGLGIEHYYSTLFRELLHWSGHPQRLNRSFDERFDAKVAEEFTAALGSVFLCAGFNINPAPVKDRKATISGWIAAMQRNKFLVTAAATAAWKATDLLRNPRPAQ